MRIYVDEFPVKPKDCIFCNINQRCRLTINQGTGLNQKICEDTRDCKFLRKSLNGNGEFVWDLDS